MPTRKRSRLEGKRLQVSASGPSWQRGYYERIVRSEEELEAIRRYIVENLSVWTADPENPARARVVATAPWLGPGMPGPYK